MVDFLNISTEISTKGGWKILPQFRVRRTKDLMIRGKDFYAVWLEDRGLWSADEQDLIDLVDNELRSFYESNQEKYPSAQILTLENGDSKMIDKWHHYCKEQCRDNAHELDCRLTFLNTPVTREDYVSRRLPYALEKGDYSAYEKLVGTLYSPEEKQKIEWAVGSIISGDSTNKNQKFLVMYGEPKTGKSTVLNIIQKLFDGYWAPFDAKALASAGNQFPMEAFRENPLVAIQHDGDLSRIEDNTRLNSIVSHETMPINVKGKSVYPIKLRSFLFMGTNKPVKITDSKSGLLRRLIDVTPTGNRVPQKEYIQLVDKIDFELGAIAQHCLEVYESDPHMFDDYIPINMMETTNDFYNFMVDQYYDFRDMDGITLKAAWERYQTYCDETKEQYPMKYRIFKEELKTYWENFEERKVFEDGTRVRSYYSGFKTYKFETHRGRKATIKEEEKEKSWLSFAKPIGYSVFDAMMVDCPAQLATTDGSEKPFCKWENCKTKLGDINTSELHYVKVPKNHIVIDFDIPDENGNKSLAKNMEEACKWPKTYAELSKSGNGIHLHYIYSGDTSKLADHVSEHVEVKVFKGNSSLRRKLTLCVNLPVTIISSGLPFRKEKKVATNMDIVKDEKALRMMVQKNLDKEFHGDTSSSMNFIKKLTDDAYDSGIAYDISDMKNKIIAFGQGSHNQAKRCLDVAMNLHYIGKPNEAEAFKTLEEGLKGPSRNSTDGDIIFFDVEVFSNLFIVCWKIKGPKFKVNKMINPTPEQIEELMKFKLVGFNNRRYDNHILYARMMGYNNAQLYKLSQKIIGNVKGCLFSEAYNLSYTDIYDFANGDNKTSLKKLEIRMGVHHDELGIPWDKPVPEWAIIFKDHYEPCDPPDTEAKESHTPLENPDGSVVVNLWNRVAEYCCNDVLATEAAFDYLEADWISRQILADITGMTVNDTSNTLTTRLIFGNERNTQSELNWRDMGDMSQAAETDVPEIYDKEWTVFDKFGRPLFPGYKFDFGKSTYRGEDPSEGGYVYAEPGMYGNVALLDIASMHPSTIVAEELFGKYTERFKELLDARIAIKHEDWDTVEKMFDGKLVPYIQKVKDGEITSKQLANALKIPINSVYGLTSASFDNPFKDERNKDNIVAKRGALFMINLKHEVQRMGYTVVHIKTDSIKIADATPEIIDFVMEYGALYGYTFEHEATYERLCLVNNAVYVAKDASDGHWTATGKEFQVPYVFKKLFTGEDIVFDDYCVTQSCTTALYLDMNEGYPDVTAEEKQYKNYISKYKKGELSDTTWEREMPKLEEAIEKGHNYIFIGKVGQFVPVIEGTGGGLLMREKDGKYYNASGTSGYRWKNAEVVRSLKLEDQVDISYWENEASKSRDSINEYGDFTWFVSNDPYIPPNYISGENGIPRPVKEAADGELPFSDNMNPPIMDDPDGGFDIPSEALPWDPI